MAFITPLMRKDFNIYSKRKTDRDYRTTPITIARKTEENIVNEGTSLDSLLDRKRRMEMMRERRQRRYQRKRQPLVLRKISEINEDTETDDEPTFDDIENGFTILRRLTEGDENVSEQSSENDENEEVAKTEPIDKKQTEPKKRGVFNMFRWMRKYSLKIKQ